MLSFKISKCEVYSHGDEGVIMSNKSTSSCPDKHIEETLMNLIPERFATEIASVSIVEMKNAFYDNVVRNVNHSNVYITIRKSPYYINGATEVICKVVNSKKRAKVQVPPIDKIVFRNHLYFSELGEDGFFSIDSPQDLERLKEYLTKRLENLFVSEPFGCCGRYKSCSVLGQCVHENAFYACSCLYKKHLEKGNAFLKD